MESLLAKSFEKAQATITRGVDFGQNCGGYIRSYANSLEIIEEGLERLKKDFLSNIDF